MADLMSSGFGMLGGIIGDIAAGSDRGHSRALTDEAISALSGIIPPEDLKNLINYQQYQNAGNLTPVQEQQVNAAPSQAGAVKADPRLLAAQMQALDSLKQLSNTGMSAADQARQNQIQQQAATQAEGQRQAVLQSFAQRGLGGSGNELMSQLMASQNAANQGNQQSLQAAAQAQNAALQALSSYGNQAGNLEQQQYGQQSQSAQQNDLLNRFNTQNQIAQQQRNVAGQNNAQQFNLQNKQNIMNANTGTANQALQQQKQGEQQLFQDQLQRGQALSGANFTGANAYNNMANQTASKWANLGQGFGNMMSGGGMQAITGMFGGGGGAPDNSTAGAAAANPSVGGGGMGIPAISPALAEGGTVPHPSQCYADGGSVNPNSLLYPSETEGPPPAPPQQSSGGGGGMGSIMSMLPMLAMLAANGGKVPGKSKYPGNDYRNDKVHALLSPGEIVLPHTVTQHGNAPEMAKLFVENEMRKQGRMK